MDSRERFTAAAAAYRAHRPSYPPELVDWIAATTGVRPPAHVVDVGAGTGIASRLLAARGYHVIGVEPNDAMRAHAAAAGGARFVAGDAAATGLPGGSADLVVCAQAFHYLEVVATLAEWRRLLAPRGACATFWSRIAASPLKDEYHALRRRHAPARSASGGYRTRKQDIARVLATQPGVAELHEAHFPLAQDLDLDGLRGRLGASSRLAGAGGEALDRDVEALFSRHQRDGRVVLALEVVALTWRLA